MKLLYCRINHYGGIQEQEYNFGDDRYHFHYDEKLNEFKISMNSNKSVDNFFNIDNSKNSIDIKLLAGKNGVGKTTLLKYIKKVWSSGLSENLESEIKDILVIEKKYGIVQIFMPENILFRCSIYLNEKLIKEYHSKISWYRDIIEFISIEDKTRNLTRYKFVEGTELYLGTSLINYNNFYDFNWFKSNYPNDRDYNDISLSSRIYVEPKRENTFFNYQGHIENPDNRFQINRNRYFLNRDIEKKIKFLAKESNKEFLEDFMAIPPTVYIMFDYMVANNRNDLFNFKDILLRYEKNSNNQFISENLIYSTLYEYKPDKVTSAKITFFKRIIDSYFTDIEAFLIFDNLKEDFKKFEEKHRSDYEFYGFLFIEEILGIFSGLFKNFADEYIEEKEMAIHPKKFIEGFKKITETYSNFIYYLNNTFFEYPNVKYFDINSASYNQNRNGTSMGTKKETCVKIDLSSSNIKIFEEFINYYREIYTASEFIVIDWPPMSTGEDNLFTLLSELYDVSQKVRCDEIFLLIDEGDMGLHPEWQRNYIYILLKFIEQIFKNKEMQIILTSHSPLLISDFPKDNILFLKKDSKSLGIVNDNVLLNNTFAANIHNIYREGQFLSSTTGEFATQKINKVIDFIYSIDEIRYNENFESLYKQALNTIQITGEPLIKNQLFQMLEDKMSNIKSEINSNDLNHLKRLRQIIEAEIKDLENRNDID